MSWEGPFIAVDWGTTNRRAWRIAPDGTVEEACADTGGITAVRERGFADEAAALRARLGDLPMLLGGMIGSDRGWRNVPYAPCPADARALAEGIDWIDSRTGIVPGVCQPHPAAPEVMRGEEVQIVGGLACRALPPDALVCCPGTHAKWVRIEGGRIVRFATWMTGEVFALLSRHSILAPQLEGEAQPGAAFAAGVADSAGGDALGHLFGLRAGHVLGHPRKDAPSYASGLLIGAEVRAALARFGDTAPALVGRTDLGALYAAALAQVRGKPLPPGHIIDGEAAFREGLRAIIRELP
ncbi:2-dehydro-3-deoxygalactonokinase [Erythrobacter sp. NE805]|uniref:2-dehydro-3-deoxygalactonokinase n=1 Tax=Erythrobacter sp. NE805 TaxID=3389875 RepID=UPI00396B3A46